MASEITYAEVKFKNESPAPVVKVPPEMKKPEQHPQKYPLWLPWLISLLLLLVCIALVIVLLVVPFWPSSERLTALQQQFSEWKCDSAGPQGTDRAWTCCPKSWIRFQRNCYFLSQDRMNWIESEQNCTGMGSQLVVINSRAEQIKKDRQRENFYIGLFAEKVHEWQWVDNAPYNATAAFWRPGEPSNSTDETSTVMHALTNPPNNWNDVRSVSVHHRICEATAVTV